jgi:hypothetical protein
MLCHEKGRLWRENLPIQLKKSKYISLFVNYILTLHRNWINLDYDLVHLLD